MVNLSASRADDGGSIPPRPSYLRTFELLGKEFYSPNNAPLDARISNWTKCIRRMQSDC